MSLFLRSLCKLPSFLPLAHVGGGGQNPLWLQSVIPGDPPGTFRVSLGICGNPQGWIQWGHFCAQAVEIWPNRWELKINVFRENILLYPWAAPGAPKWSKGTPKGAKWTPKCTKSTPRPPKVSQANPKVHKVGPEGAWNGAKWVPKSTWRETMAPERKPKGQNIYLQTPDPPP